MMVLPLISIEFSGSDGLMKLWDLKTSTCAKSIDAHEGKIWGMAASSDENLLVTCANDSSVIIWRVSRSIGHDLILYNSISPPSMDEHECKLDSILRFMKVQT